jgi:hypothetical protein
VNADLAVQALLGIRGDVPLTRPELIESLTVSFFPAKLPAGRLDRFLRKLHTGLQKQGVKILEFEDALAQGGNRKVNKGVVLIAAPDFIEGHPPTHFVSSLSANIIVGIYDKGSPLAQHASQQARIDVVISQMIWDIVQLVVYVQDEVWTVCNMNGAIIPCPNGDDISEGILETLIPKLGAPVIPPRAADFQIRAQSFDPRDESVANSLSDLVDSGPIWEQTGLFVYQTSLAKLKFRNPFMRRLGTAFVDHRSGMSFGFLVRQLPQIVKPALILAENAAGDWDHLCLRIGSRHLMVEMPEVWVLCTRSGCIKTQLDPRCDIVRMGLSKGQFILETPKELESESDCKPSYDTGVILAHALANVVIASVLARLNPASSFLKTLQTSGLAQAHWHGYLSPHELPPGYVIFGQDNIPFACSTPQSTILAFQGKLAAFESEFCRTGDYLGDIHIEPHHGTNMTGSSLTNIARWLLDVRQSQPPATT